MPDTNPITQAVEALGTRWPAPLLMALDHEAAVEAWQLESGKLLTLEEMERTRDFGAVWGLVETQRPKRVLVVPFRSEGGGHA